MSGKEKISSRQFVILVILFTVGTTILITPSGLTAEAKQDAWITVIIGTVEGLLLGGLYASLAKRFPALTIAEMCEALLGKWVGKAATLWFASFGVISAATVVWVVGNFLVTEVMPDTPLKIVNLMFVIIVYMGSRTGIETLARSAELAFPVFVGLLALFFLFGLPLVRMDNMMPIFETGIKPHLRGALSYNSISFLPLVVFLMFVPAGLSRPLSMARSLRIAIFIGGTIMVLVMLLNILALGSDQAAKYTYVSYLLAQKINLGGFLQHIEVVVAGIWLTGMYYKTCIYYYSAVAGIARAFHVSDNRFLILPLGMIMYVFANRVYPNTIYEQTWDTKTWIPYTIAHGLLLPLLLLFIAAIRKKKIPPRSVT